MKFWKPGKFYFYKAKRYGQEETQSFQANSIKNSFESKPSQKAIRKNFKNPFKKAPYPRMFFNKPPLNAPLNGKLSLDKASQSETRFLFIIFVC